MRSLSKVLFIVSSDALPNFITLFSDLILPENVVRSKN